MSQRALLLVNQQARRGQAELTRVVDCLMSAGFSLVVEQASQPQMMSELMRSHRDQVDLIIVGGGDGTLNSCIEGIMETGLPLAILPLGTANDLARTLGIPTSIPQACQVIARGRRSPIDLGWVNGKYFFNVASLGFSVKITQKLNKNMKQRWGVLAYGVAAIRMMAHSVPFSAEIHVNNTTVKVKTVQIAVGNGRYYGGGMAVAADAAINDQRLDLYSLEIDHWWKLIALLPAMRSGTHASWSFVRSLSGQEIKIFTRKSHAINTDGEITTATPAYFRVIPQAISVIVP